MDRLSEPAAGRQAAETTPRRNLTDVAQSIAYEWHRQRWRAYAAALVAAIVFGGVLAPLATSTLLLLVAPPGRPPAIGEVAWDDIVSRRLRDRLRGLGRSRNGAAAATAVASRE